MELKFKAWDIRQGVMISNAIELIGIRELVKCELDLGNPFSYFDGLIWLPYSNIKDKDGTELYAGDIVKVYEDDNLFIIRHGKVEREVLSHDRESAFKVEISCFYFESVNDGKPYFSILDNANGENDIDHTVLLGNIYENKELLNTE